MDFGALGLEGLITPDNGASAQLQNNETRPNVYGSGFLKQQRSGPSEDDWRSFKMTRSDELYASRVMSLYAGNTLLRSNSLLSDNGRHNQRMLSFTSPKSDRSLLTKNGGFLERTPRDTTFPYYQHSPSAYTRNAAYGSSSLNSSMHGTLTGARGPFTPSQWFELEQQALIYKYINANVPVPAELIIPIRRSLASSGLSVLSSGSFASNSLGWSSFHVGFSGNTDPEPGRCRRTDGKKWRCSRDAVADQKYCERHINRGRHRSRKPVEGEPAQPVSGPTNSKVVPVGSSTSASISASTGLSVSHQQLKSFRPGTTVPLTGPTASRMQDFTGKSREASFPVLKQEVLFEESSSQSEFGLISSDSYFNLSQKNNSNRNYTSFSDFNDEETQDQDLLRHFMDDWPKAQSNHSALAWPEELKPDWTQLSMSTPMTSSDFSSSSSSPKGDKLTLSPLKLSREVDQIQVGQGIEQAQKQPNWIPISWGNSMGGPLGEALNSTTTSAGLCKNDPSSSVLNLVTEGWLNASPQLESSPTGVLQKSTFGSVSTSSTGSSPQAENRKAYDGLSFCDEVLGTTLATSSIPTI